MEVLWCPWKKKEKKKKFSVEVQHPPHFRVPMWVKMAAVTAITTPASKKQRKVLSTSLLWRVLLSIREGLPTLVNSSWKSENAFTDLLRDKPLCWKTQISQHTRLAKKLGEGWRFADTHLQEQCELALFGRVMCVTLEDKKTIWSSNSTLSPQPLRENCVCVHRNYVQQCSITAMHVVAKYSGNP